LRRKAETELGDKFDIKGSNGPFSAAALLPLTLLKTATSMDASQKAKAPAAG
jgi:hypothetical protein